MHNYAVVVNDVDKSYGDNHILKQLCMKVDKGQIYGLLGSSGCGKTTLLSAIVGRKKIESGEIWVLGEKLSGRDRGAQSVKIGYMPQETGLTREFTVKDAIFYFGRIYQMKEKEIEKRFQDLCDLLDLPPDNRFLKDCSGGQQRRVSFAVALIHKPQLLILDEPTVGIDPLLREKIWSYLVDLTRKDKISVIITTHYIEECKLANKIGLLRGGRLLAEESPQQLLTTFNTESLEEVFLRLSKEQEEGHLPLTKTKNVANSFELNSSIGSLTSTSSTQSIPEGYTSTDKLTKSPKSSLGVLNKNRLLALLDKNFKQFRRNITAVVFLLVLPIIQALLFLYCLGLDMKDIRIGIVNEESTSAFCPNFSIKGTAEPELKVVECHFKNLACRFLQHLDNNPMITKVQYNTLEEAQLDALHGIVGGVLQIPQNFTFAFEDRLNEDKYATEEMIEFGQIRVWLDMSNYQVGTSVQKQLVQLYIDFQKSLFVDCNHLPKAAEYPVNVNYIYGIKDEAYQVYIMPGAIVCMIFFVGSIMTSTILVSEKEEGVWDRSIIAGVTSAEFALSHLLVQGTVAIFQTMEEIIIVYNINKLKYVGSIVLMHVIVYVQGLCGMSYGLFASAISINQTMTNNVVLGFFIPVLLISGVTWPVEGMPKSLQLISKLSPNTLSIEALHGVIKKGLSLSDWKVVLGLMSSVAWIILFVAMSLFALRRERR